MEMEYINENSSETYSASLEYMQFREQIFQRAHQVCEFCHVNKATQLHHITYKRYGHELPEDVRAVCSLCHRYVSGKSSYNPKPKWADAYGQVLRRYGLIYSEEPIAKATLENLAHHGNVVLKGSFAEDWLHRNKISMEIAESHNVGFISPEKLGRYLKSDKQLNPFGYISFPETNPEGKVVDILLRAIENSSGAIVGDKWRRLHNSPGFFTKLCGEFPKTLLIVNEPISVLLFSEMGYEDIISIDGASTLRWTWLLDTKNIIFGFDTKQKGERWSHMGKDAFVLNKNVEELIPEKPFFQAWDSGDKSLIEKAITFMDGKKYS